MAFSRYLMIVITACLTANVATADAAMKVMTFNVRYDGTAGQASEQTNAWVATSGKHRRDLALAVVREADPDLLCVQEALTNQVADFQAALAAHQFYGVGRDDGKQAGEYCGIFYRRNRFEAVDQGTFWLNENTDQPGSKYPQTCCARIASWVILSDKEAGGREFLLVNTHWDHQIHDARIFSAKLILQRLIMLTGERPVILVGDFNATPESEEIQLLTTQVLNHNFKLRDAYREANPAKQANEGTYHGFRGNADGNRIDYVFFRQGFQVESCEIIRTHDGERYPADHFPVAAVLTPID